MNENPTNAGEQHKLGLSYLSQGDNKKGVYWFAKAAQQGYALAQVKIGICYSEGVGVPKNLEKSAYWYYQAAKQGNVNGQVNLGRSYATGKGVQQNLEKAKYWLTKAAQQSNNEAQEALKSLAGQVKAEQPKPEQAKAELAEQGDGNFPKVEYRKKSTEEIGQLMDYEKIAAIHLLELPKIEKQDIPSFIRCPKYEKAKNKVEQKMERYRSKVDRCEEAIQESNQNIKAMKLRLSSLDPGSGFWVNKEDEQAVMRYNDRIDQMRKMEDKIENAIEKHNDLIDKHTEAVEEAEEKQRELTLEAMLVIDEDIVAVLDRCTNIVDKLTGSQDIENLVAAIDICLIELRIYAMFEDKIEDNTARKDCRERIVKTNQMFASLCTNKHVLNYLVDIYRRNLSLLQKNLKICQQIVQVLDTVDQGQMTTLMRSIDAVLTENINTNFEYEGVIDPTQLDVIIEQIKKTLDALKQSIIKANQAAAAASEFAKTGVSANQQAETLLTSMRSNVEALKDDILSRSHFAVQMIEEAVIDDFYHKDLRSAVIALRQHLVGVIGEKNLNDLVMCDKDRFSLEKAHNAIREANLVRLQDALSKVPEHIKKTTELIVVVESDIRKANEVPKQNTDALNVELRKKYILVCFPLFGCIYAFKILRRVKTFESAFRSTNQIYRDLGSALLVKNSIITTIVMIIGAIFGFGGMAAFFWLNLGRNIAMNVGLKLKYSVAVNVGVPGTVLVFYIITILFLILVGKRLRSFL